MVPNCLMVHIQDVYAKYSRENGDRQLSMVTSCVSGATIAGVLVPLILILILGLLAFLLWKKQMFGFGKNQKQKDLQEKVNYTLVTIRAVHMFIIQI